MGQAEAERGDGLDLITIGRSSVDLYGQQIGSRLEDIASFAKSVGGCPANIAIGAARLGLRSALVTRVGDEGMGRFVREQLAREGVALAGVTADPARLTALVLLSVEDEHTFPLIFYRENCADMALEPADIDEAFIASAKAVVVTGTHFSTENTAAAQRKAIHAARAAARRVVLDIDYRPNLWGLAGHAAGEARYIRSEHVTRHLHAVLPDCDLIVGTEEEVHIASGEEDTLAALRAIRAISAAVIVLKRGPMGCVVFPGAIPDTLEGGIVGRGFPVEVYNVLGAGDAFLSGFLRGWLRGESLETAATWANACGAFAVSRLLCSPEIPTWTELQHFLRHGSQFRALRRDETLNHIHWATTRRATPETLMAFAIDDRAELERMADKAGAPRERIAAFKRLAVRAAGRVAVGRPGCGVLLDGTHGREALFDAGHGPLWIGRPVEAPGSRPLRVEGGADIGSRLVEWPVTHTIVCRALWRPDDPAKLKREQGETLLRVYEAARRIGRELLVEIVTGEHRLLADDTLARVLDGLYDLELKPDWWALEPQASPDVWNAIGELIAHHDPLCRGVLLAGPPSGGRHHNPSSASPSPLRGRDRERRFELPPSGEGLRQHHPSPQGGGEESAPANAFTASAETPVVKGFIVGRAIFEPAARAWLAGEIDDEAAIADMAEHYARFVTAWQDARGAASPA